jgi:hypothetical protein
MIVPNAGAFVENKTVRTDQNRLSALLAVACLH